MADSFESHKARIRELYLVKDYSLKDVMSRMKDLGFDKSKQQYERQFKKWGLAKNSDTDTWKAINFKILKRSNQGRASAVYKQGRLLPAAKVDKSRRRQGHLTVVEQFRETPPSTPEGYNICSPASPSAPLIFVGNLPFVRLQDLLVNTLLSNAAPEEDLTGMSLAPSSTHEASIHALPQALISGKLDDTLQQLCVVLFQAANNLLSGSTCRNTIERTNESRLCALFGQLFSFDSMLCKAAAKSLLMAAIDLCARSLTQTLLRCIDNINTSVSYRHDGEYYDRYTTPLEFAVICGDLEIFRLVYSKSKSSPGLPCEECPELTAYETAIRHSQVPIIRFILDSGFSPVNIRKPILSKLYDLLPVLIQSEADDPYESESAGFNTGKDVYDQDSLCNAARSGDSEFLQACLSAGVSANARNNRGSALYQACLNHQTDVMHLLSRKGASVDCDFARDWRTPLFAAVFNDDADMIGQLLIIGTDSRPPDLIDGMFSPVRLAIHFGRTRVMEKLLTVPVIDWSVYNLNLALELAIGSKSEPMIRLLLDAGANVNHPLGDPFCGETTALIVAVDSGDVSMVKFLLDMGAEPNRKIHAKDEEGRSFFQSLLRKAVTIGDHEMVQLLLKAGANVNDDHMFDNSSKHNRSKETAFQAACRVGDRELVQLLLDAGAEINAPGTGIRGSKTALQAAAYCGHYGLVKLLLDAGADVNAPAACTSGRTALQAAAEHGHCDLVRLLLDAGADVNAPAASMRGRTALQAAAELGHCDLVELLLNAGADVNAPVTSISGRTALQAAADKGHYEIVRLLGHAGANPNGPSVGMYGKPALGAAIRAGCFLTTKFLLDFDADTGCGSHFDHCVLLPIQAAAKFGRKDLVNLLYRRGADINAAAKEPAGRTALQAAAEEGHLEIVHWLLARDAHVNAPPAKDGGLTALQAASRKGSFDIVHMLLEKGADVNAPPAEMLGYTALAAASEAGALDIVYILLENGADVNAAYDCTALECAAASGRLDIGRLLLNVGAETVGSRALEFAARSGHEGVVEMLQDYDF